MISNNSFQRPGSRLVLFLLKGRVSPLLISDYHSLLAYYHDLSASYAQRARTLAARDVCLPSTILTTAAHRLEHIDSGMSPCRIQRQVDCLLHWLLSQKVCWLAGQYRCRRISDSAWQTDAALAQINNVITDLCRPREGHALSFQSQYGPAFAVFHCRDARRCSLDESLQRWQGPLREQWYVRVALVLLNVSSLVSQHSLSCVFERTNHIESPWPQQREVRWSLDRRLLSPDVQVDGYEHVYPRSTCPGDAFVSLLSNAAWIVKRPCGFHQVAEDVQGAR